MDYWYRYIESVKTGCRLQGVSHSGSLHVGTNKLSHAAIRACLGLAAAIHCFLQRAVPPELQVVARTLAQHEQSSCMADAYTMLEDYQSVTDTSDSALCKGKDQSMTILLCRAMLAARSEAR